MPASPQRPVPRTPVGWPPEHEAERLAQRARQCMLASAALLALAGLGPLAAAAENGGRHVEAACAIGAALCAAIALALTVLMLAQALGTPDQVDGQRDD